MYIEINYSPLFYIMQCEGEPIIIIHENGEPHRIFKDTITALRKTYTDYAIDMRGQVTWGGFAV